MTDFDEQALVAQAQADPQVFGALYDRYFDRIYGFIRRRVHDQKTAEDLTAATFEAALRKIGRFQWRGGGFGAWLYRIARNKITSHHRKARWLVPLSALLNGQRQAIKRASFTDHFELSDQLTKGLAALRLADQEIIALRFFEGLSSDELTLVLGCSKDNVYLRLHRALKRLRAYLDEAEQDLEANNDQE